MPIKLAILFTFLFYRTVHAQNTFEKIIDTLGCASASCIQETFDNGYVFCGTSTYGGNDVIVVKLDSFGTIEWAKVYGGPGMEGATHIEQTPDSGYMVNAIYDVGLNSKCWLLRLDINGDTLWTQTYSAGTGSTTPSSTNSMASYNSTIYAMTGHFISQPIANISSYFNSVIGNGFPLGNKVYNYSAFGTEAYAINYTFDGGFIISAAYGTTSSLNDFYLIRTNAFGDTLWTKTYDNSQNDAGMAVQQTADSGFIVAGYTRYTISVNNIYLIKTDSNGDTLWTRQITDTITANAKSVHQTSDGGYIIVGVVAVPPTNTGNIYLIRTDSNGDTLWTRQYGDSLPDLGYFVRQTVDGGYIVSGTGAKGGAYGAYVIKTDSLGILNSGTGLTEVNNPFFFDFYPNPTSGIFYFRVNGVSGQNAFITFYNMIGQHVFSSGVISNTAVQVDLTGIPDGMYAVSLRTNTNTYTKKIILQH
jgi:hypothetical protein